MKGIWKRMMSAEGKRWLRIASYFLIVAGAILLVAAGVNVGYRQWERRRLEVRLTETMPTKRAMPTLALRSTTAPTAVTGQTPADTLQPPTVTPLPSVSAAAATEVEVAPTPTPLAATTVHLPVRITFPDLEIDAPVVEMGWEVAEVNGKRTSVWDLDAIQGGVGGHLINSALPGQPGNVVIAGHHNIEGEVFKNISLAWDDNSAEQHEDGVIWRSGKLNGRTIAVGDAAGQAFTYVVEAMYKLPDSDVSPTQRLENGRFMAPTSEPMLTLVTCWPFNTNTHRIVVVAKLVRATG